MSQIFFLHHHEEICVYFSYKIKDYHINNPDMEIFRILINFVSFLFR